MPKQREGALPGGGVDLDARYQPVDDLGSWLNRLRLEMLASSPDPLVGRIPHRLFQSWKDAHPPRKTFSPRWPASIRAQNPGWDYRLWTDADNRALVAERYPWFLAAYDRYPSPIQRADAARYFIAHAHGGVYADLDTECFRPFEPLLGEVCNHHVQPPCVTTTCNRHA